MISMYIKILLFCNLIYLSFSFDDHFVLSFKYFNGSKVFQQCVVSVVPTNYKMARNESKATFSDVYFSPSYSLCSKSSDRDVMSKVIVISNRGKCSLATKLKVAKDMKVKMIILMYSNYKKLPKFQTEIPVALMGQQTILQTLKSFKCKAALYGTIIKPTKIFTTLVLSAIVLFTILSIVFCTLVFHKELHSEITQATSDLLDTKVSSQMKYLVVIIPVILTIMLLLLYFFYWILVYVTIFMYFWISALAMALILMLPVLKYSLFSRYVYPVKRWGIENFDLRFFLIFCVTISISIVWVIYRNTLLGLILNNITGYFICVEASLQIGSLFAVFKKFRIIGLLLVVMIIFDAFMVYVPVTKQQTSHSILPFNVTPATLSRPKRTAGSIMESVAISLAQNNQGEEIPIRFKIPIIQSGYDQQPYDQSCFIPSYSLIGFGDLAFPGFYIVFMMMFAVSFNNHKKTFVYALSLIVGYTLGLVLVNVALILSTSGQPALVFILPCLLLFSIVPTLIFYPDLKLLWNETDWSIVPPHLANQMKMTNSGDKPLESDDKSGDLLEIPADE